MNIFDVKKVHLIGIGGISMSSIAHILLEKGIEVSGSDQATTAITKELQEKGATVYLGHNAKHIQDQEIIIYTGAINKKNPEIVEAIKRDIPLIQRTVALNDVLQLHKKIIAIAGTHGKTTVTSMVTHILRASLGDISYMIGAHLHASGKSYNLIDSDYITVEACEYQANFLKLFPTTLVVNNIEPEHMDYYKSIDQLIDTFITFSHNLPENGNLIINADDGHCKKLLKEKRYKTITYGIDQAADYNAKNIQLKSGKISFELFISGEYKETIELNLFGKYNISNALGAIASCHIHGINLSIIKKALASFVNSDRRFEYLGDYLGAKVISDYAHHPSEVKASISGATAIDNKKIVLIFQPHTYSRTKTMMTEFATAFKNVDKLYISDIYAAREENIYNVHSEDLCAAINATGQNANYIGSLDNLKSILKQELDEQSVLIMMGAGTIDEYARQLVE